VFPERASLRSPPVTDAQAHFAGRRSVLTLAAMAIPSLAGCGFKLREAPVFVFKTVAVPGNSRFVNQVRRNLATAGTVQVVPAAQSDTAEAILDILAEARERAVVSTTAAGAVRELALRLRVRFRLRASDGRELLGPNEIVQSRDISYNETAALAKEGEEQLLYRDMENDIAQQLLRRLAAVK
jgi:LPS-assembly lipoprotein